MSKQLLKFLPLIILVVAAGAFMGLVATRKAPERRILPDRGPLVEAIAAPTQSLQVIVEGQGSVQPTDEIDLVPQVSGIIIWTAPQLEAGGFFARGDVLLRIDPRDYDLAVTRAEAAVARAGYQLELAQEEAIVARQEWDVVRQYRDLGSPPSELVLRLPQVRAAQADLLAAEAGLAEARLRRERTEIRAPFNGRVRQTSVDAGQFVMANQPVCRIYSIERAQIVVAVANEDMAWLTIPRQLPDMPTASLSTAQRVAPVTPPAQGLENRQAAAPLTTAPRARIHTDYAGRTHTWEGSVSRAAAELDARSRMLRLVIEVDAPYANLVGSDTPLLVGMFVDVEIFGATVDDVRLLPRSALREGDVVWVADAAGTLRMRPAQVIRVRDEEVLVRLAMTDREHVIISQLSGPTDGMQVRVQVAESQQ
ncbi:MAG: efflux RND transporter periplasmic adaptor subunit [bacterium]|nr:efflux RND transporter periplasmic adaptor subunit [bacterium]